MLFLPIVARELRVRAKQHNTHLRRTFFVTIALLTCLPSIFQISIFGLAISGMASFNAMAWISFFLTLMAVMITSDCLSHERRDGTLGFLFLTNLTSWDVVLGKITAVSLEAFTILLGFIPLLSITLLLGGVNGSIVVKTSFTLLATLAMSLSLGMWISAKESREFRILVQSVLWIIGLCAVPLILSKTVIGMIPWFLLSPLTALNISLNVTPQWKTFYLALICVSMEAVFFLIAANRTLKNNWRQTEGKTPVKSQKTTSENAPQQNQAIRVSDPISHLLQKMPGYKAFPWIIIFFGTFGILTNILMRQLAPITSSFYLNFYALNIIANLIFSGIIAWLGCRFFCATKKSGQLETLMASPVAKDIVTGQWQFFKITFSKPVAIIAAINLLPGFLEFRIEHFFYLLMNASTIILNIIALFWVGVAFGMKLHKPMAMIIQTVLMVHLLPGLLYYLLMIPMQYANLWGASSSLFFFAFPYLHGLMQVGINILVIFVAKRYLRNHLAQIIETQDLRQLASELKHASYGFWHKLRNWQAS